MSKFLFTIALLLSACILPLAAHADVVDDFVLTGNGTTITFSLPASPPGNMMTCPPVFPSSCLPGSETAFTVSTMVTTNFGTPVEENITFPTFRFGGGLDVGLLVFKANEALFTPDAANPTFVPGTYDLFPLPPIGPNFDADNLTITAENAATPEPSSVVLLTTGVLGLMGFAGIKCRRASRHAVSSH